MAVEQPDGFNRWVGRLEGAADMEINTFAQFLEAILKRHDSFHQAGCRLSDHGLEQPVAEPYSGRDIQTAFDTVRRGEALSKRQILQFKSAMLIELARMDAEKQWTQQFHLGALRNTNSRAMQTLGPDTGYDTIGDFELARPLAAMLDSLDRESRLAKTILYVLNPRDNELIATMIGNFQGGGVPGRIQFGSGWIWLVKNPDGSLDITATSNAGNPLHEVKIPLLTCDVWEHAYYIDYRNARPKYIEAYWNLVNWDFVAGNFT